MGEQGPKPTEISTDSHALAEYLQQHPKRVLIFDFEGTLVTLRYPWPVFRERAREIIQELDPQLLESYHGELVVPLINLVVAKHGHAAKEPLCAWREEFERDYLEEAHPNHNLLQFIKDHQQYRYFIWSSNMGSTIQRSLANCGMPLGRFERIVSMETVDLVKPYPDGFYQISNLAPGKRADFLLVGDSQDDRSAAQASGIDFFQINKFVPNRIKIDQ